MQSLLYLPCHSIAEANEVSMFHKLGFNVFSPGSYIDPQNPHDPIRSSIPGMQTDPVHLEAWNKMCASIPEGVDPKDHLTPEFLELFDMVVIHYLPNWVWNNWSAYHSKIASGKLRVIWRTNGQSIGHIEKRIAEDFVPHGLEIVRYSPKERTLPYYAGENALIRFSMDDNEYCGWNGNKARVINITQEMQVREPHC